MNAVTRPRHFMSSGMEVLTGFLFFLAGSWFIYQAYNGRGRDQPRLIRPFTWW